MEMSVKKKLMNEYVKSFKNLFRILELAGFCRFVIRNGKVVERGPGTMLYNICVLIVADACATYLLWFPNSKEQNFSLVEFIAIMHFSIFANLLISNITFGDKYRGLDLILNCIEIDNLLGAKETEFMRERSISIYRILFIFVGITQLFIVAYLYYVFNVSIAIHIVGSLYFFWMFFAYDDFCFFVYLYSFLTTRVRYLNVALMKITKIKMEYLPRQKLFNQMFWKDEYDERVTFHTTSDTKKICIALRMLFVQLRCIENCYSFPLILGAMTVAVGSIVSVQTFIMHIQTSDAMLIRASAISGWSVASWFQFFGLSLQADLFYRQIGQTKLICAYIQLKPNTSVEILKLTKDIYNTLEVRDVRVSVYGMFSFDTGLVLKIAASTFVYITVQLQLAFPNLKEVHKIANVTLPPPDFDFNPLKVKEFWFF